MRVGNPRIDLSDEGQRVIIWQYSNAPKINAVIENEVAFWGGNVSGLIQDWTTDVFNLKTANSFGLEVWGRILGTKRPLIEPQNYMIDESGHLRFYNPNTKSWHVIFLDGIDVPTIRVEVDPDNPKYAGILLNDEAYRRCLLARLFLLYSNVSINDINKYLAYMFPNKAVFVEDHYDMTMSIVFGYIPNDTELTILTYDDFSPRPAGVYMNYGVQIFNRNTFSFEGMNLGTWGTNEGTLDPELVKQGLGTFYTL